MPRLEMDKVDRGSGIQEPNGRQRIFHGRSGLAHGRGPGMRFLDYAMPSTRTVSYEPLRGERGTKMCRGGAAS